MDVVNTLFHLYTRVLSQKAYMSHIDLVKAMTGLLLSNFTSAFHSSQMIVNVDLNDEKPSTWVNEAENSNPDATNLTIEKILPLKRLLIPLL